MTRKSRPAIKWFRVKNNLPEEPRTDHAAPTLLIAVDHPELGDVGPFVYSGFYRNRTWHYSEGRLPVTGEVYAWAEFPEAPPVPFPDPLTADALCDNVSAAVEELRSELQAKVAEIDEMKEQLHRFRTGVRENY